ncbi:MAG: mechanosensitive ion channel domain-containing protein [Acidobacteriota bacterium]
MQKFVTEYLNPVFDLLNYNIFALGNAKITPLSIIYVVVFTIVLIYLSNKFKKLLIGRILKRTQLDIGAQAAIGAILRYAILLIGFLIILQTVGIDLTTLNVLAGAVGVGVGFGLQNVASNFISGLIILLERPIKVGDRVEVDKVNGKVIAIGARATRIRTNDNIAIIVPNSKFISENVVNWSFGSEEVRFRIPIGVGYDSDVDLVSRLLIEVGEENDDVLIDPKPAVRLIAFGESSIKFELWVWTVAGVHRPGAFKSGVNFAICRKFREHNIEIPFPQRDLNLRQGRIKIGRDDVEFEQTAEPDEK